MQVKFGSVITAGTGSLGGSVIQQNRHGYIMRTKPHPLRTNSNKQQFIRSINKTLIIVWRSLTKAQRYEWQRHALAFPFHYDNDINTFYSGREYFLKYNFYRLFCSLPYLYYPLTLDPVLVPLFVRLYRSGANLLLQVSFSLSPAQATFLFSASKNRGNAKSFRKAGIRFIFRNTGSAINYDITAGYVNAFGSVPAVGNTIHYSITWFYWYNALFLRPRVGVTTVQ